MKLQENPADFLLAHKVWAFLAQICCHFTPSIFCVTTLFVVLFAEQFSIHDSSSILHSPDYCNYTVFMSSYVAVVLNWIVWSMALACCCCLLCTIVPLYMASKESIEEEMEDEQQGQQLIRSTVIMDYESMYTEL